MKIRKAKYVYSVLLAVVLIVGIVCLYLSQRRIPIADIPLITKRHNVALIESDLGAGKINIKLWAHVKGDPNYQFETPVAFGVNELPDSFFYNDIDVELERRTVDEIAKYIWWYEDFTPVLSVKIENGFIVSYIGYTELRPGFFSEDQYKTSVISLEPPIPAVNLFCDRQSMGSMLMQDTAIIFLTMGGG